MDQFTPIASTVGGTLIGLSAVWMLLFHGRIAGISGIFGTALSLPAGDLLWRIAFVAGLLLGGALVLAVHPSAMDFTIDRSLGAIALAGFLVGVGTRMGSGCTSGHGVCGLSRLSRRSALATLTFMTVAALTVLGINAVFGGAL